MAVRRDDIAGPLRDRILAGEYKPGSKLPSFRALAKEFGAARGTAADAIHSLALEGLVVIKDKSSAVVLPRTERERKPETRLVDAKAELQALRSDVRDVQRRLSDVAQRVDDALSKLGD